MLKDMVLSNRCQVYFICQSNIYHNLPGFQLQSKHTNVVGTLNNVVYTMHLFMYYYYSNTLTFECGV